RGSAMKARRSIASAKPARPGSSLSLAFSSSRAAEPTDAVAFTASASLPKTMDLVRNFLFERGLLGNGAPSADVIGIEMPDGKILGDNCNVKLRFTETYMNAAADGSLGAISKQRCGFDRTA
ncbi:hypothetical protein ACCS53_37260, partial [Rhizobium ruizarguesonis]